MSNTVQYKFSKLNIQRIQFAGTIQPKKESKRVAL